MKCGFRPLIHFPETEEGEDEMARPNWEYVRLDVLMPEHPKIAGLSDKAFRAFIELLCYCGRQRTDGVVDARTWKRHGTARARAELVGAGLVEPLLEGDASAGVTLHDYLGHQRSREEIDELSQRRTEAAKRGAAARWGKGGATGGALADAKPHAVRTCGRIA